MKITKTIYFMYTFFHTVLKAAMPSVVNLISNDLLPLTVRKAENWKETALD